MARSATAIALAAALLVAAGIRTPAAAALKCQGLAPTIKGSSKNDRIKGTSKRDVIVGLGGDDRITDTGGGAVVCGGGGRDVINISGGTGSVVGGPAGDTIQTADGSDRVVGGEGNDVVSSGSGADEVIGGKGEDELKEGTGGDRLDGGEGRDLIDLRPSMTSVTVDLGNEVVKFPTGTSESSVVNVEDILGSPQPDELTGDAGGNNIDGHGGRDILLGVEGDDTLVGGDGADTIQDTQGSDVLSGSFGDDELSDGDGVNRFNGGSGEDRVFLNLAPGPVEIDLEVGTSIVSTPDGAVESTVSEIEHVFGSLFSDTIRGDMTPNDLVGHEGDDEIYGREGFDIVDGGRDDDICVDSERTSACEDVYARAEVVLDDTNLKDWADRTGVVDFDRAFKAMEDVCLEFTFVTDLLDPREGIVVSLASEEDPALSYFENSTNRSELTLCLKEQDLDDQIELFEDGYEDFVIEMIDGSGDPQVTASATVGKLEVVVHETPTG